MKLRILVLHLNCLQILYSYQLLHGELLLLRHQVSLQKLLLIQQVLRHRLVPMPEWLLIRCLKVLILHYLMSNTRRIKLKSRSSTYQIVHRFRILEVCLTIELLLRQTISHHLRRYILHFLWVFVISWLAPGQIPLLLLTLLLLLIQNWIPRHYSLMNYWWKLWVLSKFHLWFSFTLL